MVCAGNIAKLPPMQKSRRTVPEVGRRGRWGRWWEGGTVGKVGYPPMQKRRRTVPEGICT